MKQKREFSKTLLIQESALIWISTLAYIVLAFYCIYNGYMGSLPWLTASASLPWAAYGVSQVYYYKKSMAENTKDGVKYASVMKELDEAYNNYKKELNNTPTVDNTETTSMSYYTEDDYSDNSDPINTDYGI
ncbi:MAG: hypothetical protein MSA89_15160 [Clostridium sp.]|jgi:hypothetical protein|nr:hypothetical protein [Clostridium sp.]